MNSEFDVTWIKIYLIPTCHSFFQRICRLFPEVFNQLRKELSGGVRLKRGNFWFGTVDWNSLRNGSQFYVDLISIINLSISITNSLISIMNSLISIMNSLISFSSLSLSDRLPEKRKEKRFSSRLARLKEDLDFYFLILSWHVFEPSVTDLSLNSFL